MIDDVLSVSETGLYDMSILTALIVNLLRYNFQICSFCAYLHLSDRYSSWVLILSIHTLPENLYWFDDKLAVYWWLFTGRWIYVCWLVYLTIWKLEFEYEMGHKPWPAFGKTNAYLFSISDKGRNFGYPWKTAQKWSLPFYFAFGVFTIDNAFLQNHFGINGS